MALSPEETLLLAAIQLVQDAHSAIATAEQTLDNAVMAIALKNASAKSNRTTSAGTTSASDVDSQSTRAPIHTLRGLSPLELCFMNCSISTYDAELAISRTIVEGPHRISGCLGVSSNSDAENVTVDCVGNCTLSKDKVSRQYSFANHFLSCLSDCIVQRRMHR